MDVQAYQARIDQIPWYHEFDFPGGLVARSKTPDIEAHRLMWAFIRRHLDQIDFTGKSVLDLGCWDGYWSFYAERRGARRVLAADDRTQNWSGNQGVLLAKELLDSSIDVRLDVSIYDLHALNETFDIILCMGIFYHLVDPIFAFSQVRHRCHRDSLVVFEGEGTHSLDPQSVYYDLSDSGRPVFMPTQFTFRQMLEANYFDVAALHLAKEKRPAPPPWTPWKTFSRGLRAVLGIRPLPPPLPPEWVGLPAGMRDHTRFLAVCRPMELANPLHTYRPPFGLHRYDDRFRGAAPSVAPARFEPA